MSYLPGLHLCLTQTKGQGAFKHYPAQAGLCKPRFARCAHTVEFKDRHLNAMAPTPLSAVLTSSKTPSPYIDTM